MAHLFQRTKKTAATIPTADRQNGDTSDTVSTVLLFSVLCALLTQGLGIFRVTDSLEPSVIGAVRIGLELFFVGATVVEVKLFGLSLFLVDCIKVDVVLCKFGPLFVVPLFTRVGVDEVDKGSFSKRKKKELSLFLIT